MASIASSPQPSEGTPPSSPELDNETLNEIVRTRSNTSYPFEPEASSGNGSGASASVRARSRNSPFASTLIKNRDDLSPQSLLDLQSHRVTQELSSQVFGRFCSEKTSPVTSPKSVFPSRPNFNEDSEEDDTFPDEQLSFPKRAFANKPPGRQSSLRIRTHSIEHVPRRTKSAVVKGTSSPDGSSSMQVPATAESRAGHSPLTIQPRALNEKIDVNIPHDASSSAAIMPLLESTDTVSIGNAEEAHELAPQTRQRPSEELIERALDVLIRKHHTQYLKDKRTLDKDNSSLEQVSHPSFHAYYTQKKRREDENTSVAMATVENRIQSLQIGMTEPKNPLTVIGESNVNTTPPLPVGLAPNSATFTCIFTVDMTAPGFLAPLSSHGRPIIPQTAELNRYTVLSSYHATHRRFVIDITVYRTGVPRGFNSRQIVDLLYLQQREFIQPFFTEAFVSTPSQPFSMVGRWSLCSIQADGLDVLLVSDIEVMVYCIVNSMFKVATSNGIEPDKYAKTCAVILGTHTPGGKSAYRKVTMPIGLTTLPEWEWKEVKAEHQNFYHSTAGMPMK